MQKVFVRTFGCRANQYDSETVRAMVLRGGSELVNRVEEADIAVFNSCAVTAEAEVDLRKNIRRAARKRPQLRTVVMGCAASLDRGALRALPTVSAVVPGADFAELAGHLHLPAESLGAAATQQGTRGLLRIQDGCDEHCTFCATTMARGANRSRGLPALLNEARRLAEHHAEVVLTGIHIGTWGHDIGSTLGVLVESLMTQVPSVRFRLSSIEATELDNRLIGCLQHPRQLVPHVHAPLQSGSDRVLKRMGRHWYTARRYAEAVNRLHQSLPVFGLGADVIAGFPGETDDDFAATLALAEELPFTYLHVFPFSLRPGTAAERLDGQLTAELIQRRARALRELGERKAAAWRAQRDRGVADVIVIRGDTREGLTEDYLTVSTPAGLSRGTRVDLELTLDATGTLRGALPEEAVR
jgi:threonylcarbamoyladenosine tRNA methylthiotransferase MtaB